MGRKHTTQHSDLRKKYSVYVAVRLGIGLYLPMIIMEIIVSSVHFTVLFTQTPIPGGLDGTIIDSRIKLV